MSLAEHRAARSAPPPRTAPPAATLLEALALEPARAWLTDASGRTASRGEVLGLARRWAATLAGRGVAPGDAVLLVLPNGIDLVAALFGAMGLGARPCLGPWPAAFTSGERLAALLEPHRALLHPRAIVTLPRFAEVLPGAVTAPAAGERALAPADPRHAAFVQLSSGTTAEPRGAVISHRAAIASAWAMTEALALGPSDRGVSWLPLHHDMGLVGSLFVSLVAGFPLELMTPAEFLFRPARWLERLSATRATITAGPNFAYALATRRTPALSLDLSALRHALDGAEPVLRPTLDDFARRFGPCRLDPAALRPVYGLAEATLGVSFATRPGPDLATATGAVPSVGAPIPGMSVEVRLPDGAVAPLGVEGELFVAGPSLASALVTAGGTIEVGAWLATGDLGVMTEGDLYVLGRSKDLLIQGGEKHRPYDLERIAGELDGVPPGGAVAVGRLDPSLGTERIELFVEHRQGAPALALELKAKVLGGTGVRVDAVHFVPIGSLPRTTSGKLRRAALREVVR